MFLVLGNSSYIFSFLVCSMGITTISFIRLSWGLHEVMLGLEHPCEFPAFPLCLCPKRMMSSFSCPVFPDLPFSGRAHSSLLPRSHLNPVTHFSGLTWGHFVRARGVHSPRAGWKESACQVFNKSRPGQETPATNSREHTVSPRTKFSFCFLLCFFKKLTSPPRLPRASLFLNYMDSCFYLMLLIL